MSKTCKTYTPEFKSKVVLEPLKEQETLAELGSRFGVNPVVGQWKKQLCKGMLQVSTIRRAQTSQQAKAEL